MFQNTVLYLKGKASSCITLSLTIKNEIISLRKFQWYCAKSTMVLLALNQKSNLSTASFFMLQWVQKVSIAIFYWTLEAQTARHLREKGV